MKPTDGNATERRPNPSTRHPSEEVPSSAMFGFPVSENQFNVLQSSEPAVSLSREQRGDRLIDPRNTRLSRLQVATRAED